MPQQPKFKPIDPNEFTEIDPSEFEDVTSPKSGLSNVWDFLNKPLITAPSDIARSVGNSMTEHTMDESPFWAKVRGFGAGSLQAIGDMVSGLTSPLGLATAATGGGELFAAKLGLPEIASLLNKGTKVLSTPYAIHGGAQVLDPNSTLAERGMGLAELSGGVAGMVHSPPKPGRISEIGDTLANPDSAFDAELEKIASDPYEKIRDEMAKRSTDRIIKSAEELKGLPKLKPITPDEFVDVAPSTTPSIQTPKVNSVTKKPVDITFSTPGEPSAIWIKNPDPLVIKQTMKKGYVFDSIRDDGAFKMIKSDKPLDLPILESEVGNARPTPANAARMGEKSGGELPPEGPSDIGGGGLPPKRNIGAEIFNFPRVVMASLDFSAPLRQGLTLIHKKQFWTSLDDMFKAWGSEKAYNAIQDSILERPLFKARVAPSGAPLRSFAEEAGLKLTDLKSLSSREEHIMSTWADKVPGVARSNRAYTAFLNKLRADTFEDLIKRSAVFGADGKANLPLARELANFVNTASGRGSLGALEKSAVTLNSMLFSPRLIASRLTMLNPRYYITANPIVRKEALKSLLAIAGVGSTLTTLGKMAGAEVVSDPRSSDFGKIKIGNTRLDPYGGFQQYIVAAQRLLRPSFAKTPDISTETGVPALDMISKTLSTGGWSTKSSVSDKESDLLNPKGPYDSNMMDVLTRFGRGKLHPVLGFAVSLLNGAKEMSGQPMNFTTMNPMDNAISQRFIPILLQDLYSIAQDDPTALPFLGPLAGFGMGTQVYGDQSTWRLK